MKKVADDDDVGNCAAIAKDKWITALTVKHADKPWESFQYRHIDVRSTFVPTKFEVLFVGDAERWKVTVIGRNLERIYMLVIQGRLEWIRQPDRDFALEDKGHISRIATDPVKR